MKQLHILFFLFFTAVMSAQIPNNGFENWADGNPVDWASSNVPGVFINVSQSSDVHSGSGAVKGEVSQFFTTLLAPVIQAGSDGTGFPVSVRYSNFKGFFKFAPVGNDRLVINCAMYVNLDSAIGLGVVAIQNAMSTYTEINIPIQYFDSATPTLCIINTTIIGPTTGTDYHSGSTFYADDFSLSVTATDVKDPSPVLSFRMEQNYPNPFNPNTTIKYAIPEAGNVDFRVYNSIGREVYREEKSEAAGEHTINFNGSKLSSGVYFYTIRNGSNISTKKFTILK